eukprot:CAMPEP_0119122856 /NCGR_PEP_ID=MMETSP1310-20130426/2978_1 /TAXON_ID=464262 /ORGANISM="Genus nov. species nov., Strain RCC2339" /LENGTH=1284 /DNA_ID=CAMNT_0007112579 /DNA_START=146 /DNA_END=4000 /DNA_ORIENTATION=+
MERVLVLVLVVTAMLFVGECHASRSLVKEYNILEELTFAMDGADEAMVSFRFGDLSFMSRMARNVGVRSPGYQLYLGSAAQPASAAVAAFVGYGPNVTRHRLVVTNGDYDAPVLMGSVEVPGRGVVLLEPGVRHGLAEGTTVAYDPRQLAPTRVAGGAAARQSYDWGNLNVNSDPIPNANLAASWPRPANCPANAAVYDIGFVVTFDALNDEFGGSASQAEAELTSLLQLISARFERDVNMRMRLGSITVLTSYGTEGTGSGRGGFNTGNCLGITDELHSFSYYRGFELADTTSDLVELIEVCRQLVPNQPVTVGLAWTNAVGLKNAFLNGGRAGEWVSGTGVNSYVGSFWMTTAHEIAHGLGAGHDFGLSSNVGIMSYTDNSWQFSLLSQGELCDRYQGGNYQHAAAVSVVGPCADTCDTDQCGVVPCVGDGTDSDCGACGHGEVCDAGACEARCDVDTCGAKECGWTACNQDCGSCAAGEVCLAAACVADTTESRREAALAVVNEERARYGFGAMAWDAARAAQLQELLNADPTCDAFGLVGAVRRSDLGSFRIPAGETYAHYLDDVIRTGRFLFDYRSGRFGVFSVPLTQDDVGNYDRDNNYFRWISNTETSRYRLLMERGAGDGTLRIACAQTACSGSSESHGICTLSLFTVRDRAVPEANWPVLPDCSGATSCQDNARTCGWFVNSCGQTVGCGECAFGQCDQATGRCSCSPKTCEGEGFPSEPVDDGCGGILECDSARRALCATPSDSELDDLCTDDYGLRMECGQVAYAAGCPPVSCGFCDSWNQECDLSSGQCRTSQETVSAFGFISDSYKQSECREGYQGDGTVCVKQRFDTLCGLDGWFGFTPLQSDGTFYLYPLGDYMLGGDDCSVRINTTAQTDCSLPECGFHLVRAGRQVPLMAGNVIRLEAILTATTEQFGIFFDGQNLREGTSELLITTPAYSELLVLADTEYDGGEWTMSIAAYAVRRGGNSGARELVRRARVPVPRASAGADRSVRVAVEVEFLGPVRDDGRWFQIRVAVLEDGGAAYDLFVELDRDPFNTHGGGRFGVVGTGEFVVADFAFETHSRVEFEVWGCPSEEDVRQRLANLLGVDESAIENVEVTCNQNNVAREGVLTPRRAAARQLAPVAGSAVVGATLKGQGFAASSLSTQLAGGLATQTAPGLTSAATPNLAVGATTAPSAAASAPGGGSSGLSGGAIAGIVIASVAGALLLITAAVLAVGTVRMNNDLEEDERPESVQGRFSMAFRYGIPVMRPDSALRRQNAGKHMTATGRGVAQ